MPIASDRIGTGCPQPAAMAFTPCSTGETEAIFMPQTFAASASAKIPLCLKCLLSGSRVRFETLTSLLFFADIRYFYVGIPAG
jgi:hypothetical protein